MRLQQELSRMKCGFGSDQRDKSGPPGRGEGGEESTVEQAGSYWIRADDTGKNTLDRATNNRVHDKLTLAEREADNLAFKSPGPYTIIPSARPPPHCLFSRTARLGKTARATCDAHRGRKV